MICFILGRESRLSIAEIYNHFRSSECIYATREFAIFDNLDPEEVTDDFYRLGGSIKAIRIQKELQHEKDFLKESIRNLVEESKDFEGKFSFAIASYGQRKDIFTIGIQAKKEAKKEVATNLRYVNKDSNNINAAVFKKEKLASGGGIELNLIKTEDNKIYFGETIAYQDVDEYSKRDYSKERDMQVGMLPPKLAQMMINIGGNSKALYDPFCGLGTVLIEAANAGFNEIYGSDLSDAMVNASQKNLSLYLEKGMVAKVFKLDASKIQDSEAIRKNKELLIVSEGFLGSIMTKGHVTEDKIRLERQSLSRMYEGFFSGLAKSGFRGKIVMCFPFWQFKGKFFYFEEIYSIFKKHGFKANKMLPHDIGFQETRAGSLLYHRPTQQVGREIFLLSK